MTQGRAVDGGRSPDPPLAIFELGLNHLGDVDRGRRMLRALAAQGATDVTLQIIERPNAYIRDAPRAERLARATLRPEQNVALLREAAALGLRTGAVIVDPEDRSRMLSSGVAFFKVLSTDITFEPLLRSLSTSGGPVYLSTGAATIDEIAQAIAWMRETRSDADIRLIHTVLAPPTPVDQLHLSTIPMLASHFEVPVAYGQHSDEATALTAATVLGAETVFVYVKEAADPSLLDGPHAIECSTAASVLSALANARAMRGGPHRLLPEAERSLRLTNRRSVVAARAIRVGSVISESDIAYKQPASGPQPTIADELIGRTADRDYRQDEDLWCGMQPPDPPAGMRPS